VNERLRDILIEEQKLREASLQESNAATHKSHICVHTYAYRHIQHSAWSSVNQMNR
ncbi:hypothetical protein XENORESO_019320, partial [Xenotaenia resolanae]